MSPDRCRSSTVRRIRAVDRRPRSASSPPATCGNPQPSDSAHRSGWNSGTRRRCRRRRSPMPSDRTASRNGTAHTTRSSCRPLRTQQNAMRAHRCAASSRPCCRTRPKRGGLLIELDEEKIRLHGATLLPSRGRIGCRPTTAQPRRGESSRALRRRHAPCSSDECGERRRCGRGGRGGPPPSTRTSRGETIRRCR